MQTQRMKMETISALLALCKGNSPLTGDFPSQRPETQSFDFFLWSAPGQTIQQTIAGDLRCLHAHYDVIVMGFENIWDR